MYLCLALCVWPYARPVLPIWVFLLAVLVPPLLPLLLFYMLWMTCFISTTVVTAAGDIGAGETRQPTIVIVEATSRGHIRPMQAIRPGSRI